MNTIEQNLQRIADATEAILKMMQPQITVALPVSTTTTTDKVAPVEIKEEKKEIKEPTEDELRNAVREFMNKNGKEKAIELLVKYGAKAEKPMIKDVTNKAALMVEIGETK